MPDNQRMMLFIDGENLVCRYQAMKEGGKRHRSTVVHEPDVFVWATGIDLPGNHLAIRAYYYTSVTGDLDKIISVEDRLRELKITIPHRFLPGSAETLYPWVFKKPRNAVGAKGVDIRMTVDILTHLYQDNLDTVFLFSGDGDYRPVIDEVIRNGKKIFVAAFSDGLSPLLRRSADKVISLDHFFFVL